MKPSMRVSLFLDAVVALSLAIPLANAETLVLDGDDVSDWASVFSSSMWKHHDACFYPNTLFKFDLSDIGPASQVLDARLDLYVERAEPGVAVDAWHVQQDTWSYGVSDPDTIWSWPVWHLMGGASFPDTGSFSLDVTAHIQEELSAAGNQTLSIKLVAGQGQFYPRIRIASPLSPIQRMRPRIVITYQPPASPSPLPDLAISAADVSMSPMRPAPGSIVTLQAMVRNLGAPDAWNVPVSFWDGAPPTGTLIGTVVMPHVGGGGGEAPATMSWAAVRGLREIVVTADAPGTIPETDETNNQGFRSLRITDPDDYLGAVESFEYPGQFAWASDFDVPKQFTYFGPKSFYINRSGAKAYHGRYGTEMVLDGTADDGTIWLETAVPVEPHSIADVAVDFELFRYFADIAFLPVVSVSPLDPEIESDFTVLPAGSHEGWWLHSYKKALDTGPYDMVHIAVGLTVTWETPGSFALDLIRTSVNLGQVGIDPPRDPGVSTRLFQNRPNPTGPLTTIAYRLQQDGPVALRIYDTAGRLLTVLRQGNETAGDHEVHWDGSDATGQPVPSGVYFYRLEALGVEESRKLMLVR